MILKILYISVLVIFGYADVLGQCQSAETLSEIRTACGRTTAELSASHQVAGDKGVITLISYLGKGEKKEKLHEVRLNTAKNFLEREWKRSPENIVLNRGESVNGLGKVEIYVNNYLTATIKVKKNGNLITKCD